MRLPFNNRYEARPRGEGKGIWDTKLNQWATPTTYIFGHRSLKKKMRELEKKDGNR